MKKEEARRRLKFAKNLNSKSVGQHRKRQLCFPFLARYFLAAASLSTGLHKKSIAAGDERSSQESCCCDIELCLPVDVQGGSLITASSATWQNIGVK